MSPSALSMMLALALMAQAPDRPGAQGHAAGSLGDLIRYEPTGLSLLEPYARGKVPVVLVHGLWSNPSSWHRMVTGLEGDESIHAKYQFWTFGYSTGDPIPYSASLLRGYLDDVRRKLDPDRSDPAFDRMVVVGHSMGGLLAKLQASDAGEQLWKVVSDRPFGELAGEKDDLELFRDGLRFHALPEVRRLIYIATPHQGSPLDHGPLRQAGTRLVRVADPLRAAHRRVVDRNAATFFRGGFGRGIPSSIDELESGSPMLLGIAGLSPSPGVKVHSIIAVRPGPPLDEKTDGLVRYASAHIEGALSEKIVEAGHLCQDHPQVIAEVRRILAEHAE